jgi:POT family proton-dependent oligopeptide transporter
MLGNKKSSNNNPTPPQRTTSSAGQQQTTTTTPTTTNNNDQTIFSDDTLLHEAAEEDGVDERSSLLRNRKSTTTSKSIPPEPTTVIPQTTYFGGLPPVAILILAAEFGERFCYYGISSVFVLYMMEMLDFGSSTINAVVNAFSFLSYTSVLLGGWIADRSWGRRMTIGIFGIIYLVGLVVLTVSASPAGYANFPENPTWAIAGLGVGLLLISLGTGGIKSNVSPLMADQLGPEASDEAIERAFQYFYWSINLGSLFGMFIAPLLQRVGGPWSPTPTSPPSTVSSSASNSSSNNPLCNSSTIDTVFDSGYYVSYAACTIIFLGAVGCFVSGWKWYVVYKPSGSIISKSFRLCRGARKGRLAEGGSFYSTPPGRDHWLWWALLDPDYKKQNPSSSTGGSSSGKPPSAASGASGASGGGGVDDSPIKELSDEALIRDLSQTLGVLSVFIVFPIYWLLYLQMSNTFVLQATMMYLPDGITADQISAADPLFLVILIPIFDMWVFPWMRSQTQLGPIKRMTIGFLLNACCMFVAGGLQSAVDASGQYVMCSGEVTFVPGLHQINVFTQLPQYFLLALSEMFASVASLDYAYSRAPASMKSVVMSFSLFQMAIGSALGLALTPIVLPQNFMWLFISMGLIMTFFAGIFYVYFRKMDGISR